MTNKPNLDYSGLRALYINCTLTKSPDKSNTQGVIDISTAIMKKNGVQVEEIRAIDRDIATGVYPDMTEKGWDSDEWPQLFEKVKAADILVIAGPIWLGDNSSVTKKNHRAALCMFEHAELCRAMDLLQQSRWLFDHG